MDCYWSLYNQSDQSRHDGLRTMQARALVMLIPGDQAWQWLAWKEGSPEWLPLSHYHELFDVTSIPLETGTASHVDILSDETIAQTVTKAHDEPGSFVTKSVYTLASPALPDEEQGMFATNPFEVPTQPLSDFAGAPLGSGHVAQAQRGAAAVTAKNSPRAPETQPQVPPAQANNAQAKADPRSAAPRFGPDAEQMPGGVAVFELDDEDTLQFEATLSLEAFQSDRRKSTRYRRRLNAVLEFGGQAPLVTEVKDLSMGGIQLKDGVTHLFKKHVKITIGMGGSKVEAICEAIPEMPGIQIRRYRFVEVNRLDLLRTWLISPG